MPDSLEDRVATRLLALRDRVKRAGIQAALSGAGIAKTQEVLFNEAIAEIRQMITADRKGSP